MTRQNDGNGLYFNLRSRFGRTGSQRAATLCVALLLGATTGCPPSKIEPPIITGPAGAPEPRPLEEIMESIHANGALLNRPLWSSSVHVTADFPDNRGKSHKYNLDGTLLYRKPRELRVDLRPAIGDPVMQIGSNADAFWIWVEPELQMMRWGKHEHVGKPCSGRMSIRPDQLVQSLGLQRLTSNDPTLAGPALTAARDYDKLTYMREYEPKRFCLDREIYVDRSPPFMIRVMRFFDTRGQESMRASLSEYKQAWANGPLVPHAMVFDWPQDGGRLSLEISKVGPPTGAVNPRAFVMPDARRLPRGVTDIVQVDAECDGGPTRRGSRRPAYEEEPIYNENASPEEPPATEPPPPAAGPRGDFRNDPNVDWSKPREPLPEGYGPPPEPPGRPRPSPIPRDPRIETYDRERGAPPRDVGEPAPSAGPTSDDPPGDETGEVGSDDETQG